MKHEKQTYQRALNALERINQINHLYCSDVCCHPEAVPFDDGTCPLEGTKECAQSYPKRKSKEYRQLQRLINTHFKSISGTPATVLIAILTGDNEIWTIHKNGDDWSLICYGIDGFNQDGLYSVDNCCGGRMDDIVFKLQDYNKEWFCTIEDAKRVIAKHNKSIAKTDTLHCSHK